MNPDELVEQLRREAAQWTSSLAEHWGPKHLMEAAADELVRLQADNERRKQAGDVLYQKLNAVRSPHRGEVDALKAWAALDVRSPESEVER